METTTTMLTENESRLANTEQVKHTETPWHATPAEDVGGGIFIGNDDNHAAFVPGYNDHPHNQANAALIVRAVNAHDDMLAALKEMVIWMPSGFAPQSKTRAMQMALAAIARAEGRAPTPPSD